MFTSLALLGALAMSPAQSGLSLSGPRVTYGELGATRTDLKFLPGDIFFLGFDIDGIKVDETGRVKYSMGMEVVNKDGAPIFKQKPEDREDYLPLGGTKLPARAFVTIGLDQLPGQYTCRVTVIDRATKATQTLEHKFDVLPKNFGLVQVYTCGDAKGEVPAPPLGVVGQSLFAHFTLANFSRDPKTKQPNLEVEMAVLTRDGQTTLPKAAAITIDNEVAPEENMIHLRFQLPLNRAGDFLVELKATDKVTRAVSRVQLPIRSIPVGN
jgi:hypothetical protein